MRESGGTAPPFLISALDGGEWSASHTGCFTSGEIAPIHTEYEAGCAQTVIWTLLEILKLFCEQLKYVHIYSGT
jgi:hypothetical protein